jgi:hypothetical protein
VVPRPSGRPWVEITPYLTADLPGTSTLDLYGDWELIDGPPQAPEDRDLSPTFAAIAAQLTASLGGRSEETQGALHAQ